MHRNAVASALGAFSLLVIMQTHAAGVFDVKTYGAKGDGNADDTKGIQSAIDACTKAGGGEVTIRGGTYSSGAVFLKSNVTLNIDGTAILRARAGGSFPSVPGRWEGHETSYAAPLITAMGASNIALKGTGKIVGDTRAVLLKNCKNVLFQDLNITCNLRWTNHLLYCEDVVCERLTVRTSGKNTDGLVIDSSKRVKVRSCTFSTGDDCIPIKSGKCLEGVRIGKPSADIDIRDCVMEKGHGGVVIGSEMSGGVENVTVENVRVRGCGNGAFRLKTNKTRGGFIRNILVNNLQVTDGSPTVSIEPFYSLTGCPDPAGVPIVTNVRVQNVRGSAGNIDCKIYSMGTGYTLVVEKCTATGVVDKPVAQTGPHRRQMAVLQYRKAGASIAVRREGSHFTIRGERAEHPERHAQ